MLLLLAMMKNIKDIINESVSPYTGSEVTKTLVEEQIVKKYGPTELKNLDCYHNLRTWKGWAKIGLSIKAHEKAIRSFTITEVKDSEGNIIRKTKRPVFLFYYRQLNPVKKSYEENTDD